VRDKWRRNHDCTDGTAPILRYFCVPNIRAQQTERLSGGQGYTIPLWGKPCAVSVHGFEPPGIFENAKFEKHRSLITMQTATNTRSTAPIPSKERITQTIEQLGEVKTLEALDLKLEIEKEITRLNATDGPLKDWAKRHALLTYYGIDQELKAIAGQLFSFGLLLENANISSNDVIMTGVREMLCAISYQITGIAGGKLPYELLPTQIESEA